MIGATGCLYVTCLLDRGLREIAYPQGGYETSERASDVAPQLEYAPASAMQTLLKNEQLDPAAEPVNELPVFQPPELFFQFSDVAFGNQPSFEFLLVFSLGFYLPLLSLQLLLLGLYLFSQGF